MSEIIFEVAEDEVDGGCSASALGFGIHTEGDTMQEVRDNVRFATMSERPWSAILMMLLSARVRFVCILSVTKCWRCETSPKAVFALADAVCTQVIV